MNRIQTELDPEILVNLNELLDQEQQRIEQILRQLDDLRSAVIRRDENGLEELMKQIQAQQNMYSQLDQRRQQMRRRLAETVGCPESQLNLTRLIGSIPAEQGDPLRRRQDTLGRQVRRLKMEHHLTELLLADCTRLNRMLLRTMLGEVGNSYNAQGRSDWQVRDRLVSVRA